MAKKVMKKYSVGGPAGSKPTEKKNTAAKPVMKAGGAVKKPLKKYQAKNSEVGTKNPDWLYGEKENGRSNSPYSVATQGNELKTKIKKEYDAQGYGPKSGWYYVEPGELTHQDSLDINANRAPTIRNLSLVDQNMKKGVKFPGLGPEFLERLKTYQALPEKYKNQPRVSEKKGGPVSTSLDKVQAYYKNKKK